MTTKNSSSQYKNIKLNIIKNFGKSEHIEIRDMIRNHSKSITTEWCQKICLNPDGKIDNEKKAEIIYNLIKAIPISENYLNILSELQKIQFCTKKAEKTKRRQYNPLNAATWTDGISNNTYDKLIDILHAVGYNIFSKNEKMENAFDSILANNKLGPDKQHRYMKLADINTTQIETIINNISNKICKQLNGIWIDRLRFVISINYDFSIKKYAEIILNKNLMTSCNIRDLSIEKYINIILEAINGANNNYKSCKIIDYSLQFYFHNHNHILVSEQNLLDLFSKYIIDIGYNLKKYDNLATIIGQLAHNQNNIYSKYLNKLYQNFIKQLDLNSEINIKMLIRLIIQSNIFPDNIQNILEDKYKLFNTGLIGSTIQELLEKIKLNKKPNDIILSRSTPNINSNKIISFKKSQSVPILSKNYKFDYNTVFFNKLNLIDFQDQIEDNIFKIQYNLKNFPSDKKLILKKIIYCLLEYIYGQFIEKIPVIISELLKLFDKKDFIEIKPVIDSVILEIDNPSKLVIWNKILEKIEK